MALLIRNPIPLCEPATATRGANVCDAWEGSGQVDVRAVIVHPLGIEEQQENNGSSQAQERGAGQEAGVPECCPFAYPPGPW